MRKMGELIERLVLAGIMISEATEIIDEAMQLGATRPSARKKKTDKKAARATRIPDDFKPDIAYARQEGLSAFQAEREAMQFINFWKAKAGAGATKLNWDLTWKNWIMRTATKLGCTPRGPVGAISASDPQSFTKDQWRRILDRYNKTGNWNPAFGPPPGSPGSLAPRQGGGLL